VGAPTSDVIYSSVPGGGAWSVCGQGGGGEVENKIEKNEMMKKNKKRKEKENKAIKKA
jgi:hypothetical protein